MDIASFSRSHLCREIFEFHQCLNDRCSGGQEEEDVRCGCKVATCATPCFSRTCILDLAIEFESQSCQPGETRGALSKFKHCQHKEIRCNSVEHRRRAQLSRVGKALERTNRHGTARYTTRRRLCDRKKSCTRPHLGCENPFRIHNKVHQELPPKNHGS